MAGLDKEIKVIAVKGMKGDNGKSSYELAVEELHYSGTLEEWIESFSTPENYITRNEFKKVTQAEYDELEANHQLIPDCYYIITDDETYDDLIERIEAIESDIDNIQNDITNIENNIDTIEGDIEALIKIEELMQEEANEVSMGSNPSVIDLNQLVDMNNYIEITGYINAKLSNSNRNDLYYFTRRLKVATSQEASSSSGYTRESQVMMLPHKWSLDNVLVLSLNAYCTYEGNVKVVCDIVNAVTGDKTISGYDVSYKILNIKELVNF